ncbi:MAG: tRNA (adenosine(37)-N6)-threonylcarbamoyltransferase complex transferase subunit TsaD [candidate division WOR-3 bacterium]|nr:tRNA (adenosine(37)-N6)-threonylcarbamoyltransferase complex transferase subunit TsaD [candidate division WOR-3 bacterium]
MIFLGVETSCDETGVSVITYEPGKKLSMENILANIVSSQYIHSQLGGVIPELASRAHIQLIAPITKTALAVAKKTYQDLDGIAVTYGPGLVGALLVGLSFAKALSINLNIPFVGVNHLEGHIFSLFLSCPELEPPFISLIISGGHTELILVKDYCQYQTLGSTQDDACGEAYDKVARMLNLPYPGGAFIEKLAVNGSRTIKFPIPQVPGYNFSFSGLKTAVLYYLKATKDYRPEDVACSFQETVIDFLWEKVKKVSSDYKINQIGVSGGVAINKRIRSRLSEYGEIYGIKFYFPQPVMCTDNGAMIAICGIERFLRFGASDLSLTPQARILLL